MSRANKEQLKAIEHDGGVLLSAGAGSGKTFVLTEHMIYLAKRWMNDFNGNEDDFIASVKSKLKKIVLMTFTNKAAGEIELRVNKRFIKELSEISSDQQNLWQMIIGELDNLTITTIHGFCFKLIKQGFFKNVNPNISLTSEALFQFEINKAFDEWAQFQEDTIRDLFLRSKVELVNSLVTIFSDPALRKSWLDKNIDDKNLYHDLLKSEQSFNTLLFKEELNFQNSEYDGKKWYDELCSFIQSKRSSFYDKKCFIDLFRFFEEKSFKIATTPRVGSVDDSVRDLYQEYKALKDFYKKYKEDFSSFEDHSKTLEIYYEYFHSLIKSVNDKYLELSLFSFSDLEYETLKGLNDKEAQEAVFNEYHYLIIDEFQDTSYSQYEIIRKIIKDDFKRIFCVGDPKQAIYGFRGGELGVFNDVQKNIKESLGEDRNMSLLNNYRSDKDIININNLLFEFIFKLGSGYEGVDDYQVKVDYQNVPKTKEEQGEIQCHKLTLQDGDEKLGVDDIEYIEACGIIENIKYNLENSKKNICILFRKLKPSRLLTKLLINENIPFISQVKVPVFEDPLLSIFNSLIRYKYNTSDNSIEFLEFEINSILNLSIGREYTELRSNLERFSNDAHYFGLSLAFIKFINSLDIASSNTKESITRINEMIKLSGGDSIKLINFLDALDSKSYNLEFHNGVGHKRVNLMSAHASKGLQFNHIILGGMYTNESSNTHYNMLGNFPGSFQWRIDLHTKSKIKTPMFILENNIKKLKEFSETKRLFYVATTRAENSLAWVDIELGDNKFSAYKNCWIHGLNKFLEEKEFTGFKELTHEMSIEDVNDSSGSSAKPLFHIDSLGAVKSREHSRVLMLPELSVTRYSLVANCPRKFYLKNILKLESESELEMTQQVQFKEEIIPDELDSKSFNKNSSMQRGSDIHEAISLVIKKEVQLAEVDQMYQDQVKWAVDNFDTNCEKTKLISEVETKFDVYGQMISGIPDLMVVNENDKVFEIWDFKTGRIKPESNDNYWAQLYFYAHYLFQSEYDIDSNCQIKLVLCYVDEKKNLEQIVSVSNVDKFIQSLRSKVNSAQLVNPKHCPQCEYNNLCRL